MAARLTLRAVAGPDPLPPTDPPTDIYFVRRDAAYWRIVHEGRKAGAYVSAEAAISYATKLALESAGLGYPAAVVKPSAPTVCRRFNPRSEPQDDA